MFKTIIVLLFANVIASTSVWANNFIYERFKVVKETNETYLTTQTKASDGLGQLLRQLKLEPNWTNRGWVTEIHKANPIHINQKGSILHFGNIIRIPLTALKDCKGYYQLKQKVDSMNPLKTTRLQPQVLKTSPIDSIKNAQKNNANFNSTSNYPPPSDLSQSAGVTEMSKSNWASTIWGGIGWSQAFNDDPASSTTTELNTQLAYQFGLNLGYRFPYKLYTLGYIQANHRSYKDPSNLNAQQELDLFLSYGLELGLMKKNYTIGVFLETAQTPRTQLISSTDINVSDDSLFKAGINIRLPFQLQKSNVLTLGLRPYYISAFDIKQIEYDSGLGVTVDLKYNFSHSKIFTGLSFNYEQQDYGETRNTLSEIHLNIGYRIL